MEIKGKVHCFFEQSKEEWRDIKGFEGLYQVSNHGRVKSLSRVVRANTCGRRNVAEKILAACTSSCGYNIVVLCKKGKHHTVSVHRLVAQAFLDNPQGLKEVNHKDENKANNIVSNLEWCNQKYNANYGTGIERCLAKKWKAVEMVDIASNVVIDTFPSARIASSKTGVSYKSISSVCNHKGITAGGYKWRFAQ